MLSNFIVQMAYWNVLHLQNLRVWTNYIYGNMQI